MDYQLPPWPILDFHSHFVTGKDDVLGPYRQEYRERYGNEKFAQTRQHALEYQKEWWEAWSFPIPEPPSSWQESARRWSGELDKYGIRAIGFVTGGGNEQLFQIVKTDRRFIGYAHHDPFSPNAAQELEKAILEYGFRGYKILAPLLKESLASESLTPLWDVAAQYEVPVLIHFGILGGGGGIGDATNINPLVIHNVAKAYPEIPFVIPHFGCGYTRELLQLCWACRNVYVDTSGNNEWMRWMPYPITLEDLFRKFYETIGPQRMVFGTDSSYFPRGFAVRYLLDQLRACRRVGIPEEHLQAIFGGNAAKLWGLDIDSL